jgi:hypothetical protein
MTTMIDPDGENLKLSLTLYSPSFQVHATHMGTEIQMGGETEKPPSIT